jgi:hypothetical protein
MGINLLSWPSSNGPIFYKRFCIGRPSYEYYDNSQNAIGNNSTTTTITRGKGDDEK